MADSSFDWDTLLDLIAQRVVVPVLGQELLGRADDSLPAQLAARVAEGLALPASTGDLRSTLALALKRLPAQDLAQRLTAAHRELLPTTPVPKPLQQIAAIRDFPLFLTTTLDGLLARALREAGGGEPVVRAATIDSFEDLPEATGTQPVVYHLFGRLRGLPDFAFTEEDVLEFVHRLHDPDERPKKLFERLKKSHLLLIGQSFPDWLARVFLRLLRGRPVSARGSFLNALADDGMHAERDRTLVLFLRDFSPQTLLYTEGDAAQFVAELHRRWQSGPAPAPASSGSAMPPGAVFVSYASADRAAAEAIGASLRAAGLPVWFDRSDLQAGDAYATVIRRHIRECHLFLALISGHTEARPDGFFRREWEWALGRYEGPGSRFLCPIVVDPALRDPYTLAGIPEEFRHLHIASAPGGQLAPELVQQLVAAVRELRSLRATAA